MPLSWNEIRDHALTVLFERYRQLPSLLPAADAKVRRKRRAAGA